MTEDFLGFNDDDDARAERDPALIVPGEKIGGHELALMARIHVDGARSEFIGKVHTWETSGRDGKVKHYDTNRVIFTTATDKFGEPIPEQWSTSRDPETGLYRSEGERWRAIMGWPVGTMPTPEDAAQFMAHGLAKLKAKWWPALLEARALDAAAARGEGEPG